MTSQELGDLLPARLPGLLVLGIKAFGSRRVLMFFLGLTMLGLVIAFKTLGVITGGRRH